MPNLNDIVTCGDALEVRQADCPVLPPPSFPFVRIVDNCREVSRLAIDFAEKTLRSPVQVSIQIVMTCEQRPEVGTTPSN
jgi:hypothetical protein